MPLNLHTRTGTQITVPDSAMELRFTRAHGPGGQHVNKVASRVELTLSISKIPDLPEDAAKRLRGLAGRRLSGDDQITVAVQDHRDQHRNRELAYRRMRDLLLRAIRHPKKRLSSPPPKIAKEKRLADKHRVSLKKTERHPPRPVDADADADDLE